MLTTLMLALAAQAAPPTPLQVADMCMFVAENNLETDSAHSTRWAWRTRFFRAAGVDAAADDVATIRAKMQRWWSANQERLLCNVPNSIVRDGSILRLAVDSSGSDFITDAVRRWRIDHN
jgi:hypothetical protein